MSTEKFIYSGNWKRHFLKGTKSSLFFKKQKSAAPLADSSAKNEVFFYMLPKGKPGKSFFQVPYGLVLFQQSRGIIFM